MNENTFDNSVKAAFPEAEEPFTLDAKIDRALAAAARGRRARRRWTISLATAAGCAAALVVMPAAQAQAAFARIAGALDDVERVTMKRMAVDEEGQRFDSGTVAYDRGRWSMSNGAGTNQMFYESGRTFTYDPLLKSYVVREAPDGPFSKGMRSMKLSSMLDSGGFGLTKRVQVEDATLNGRAVKRATFENQGLPERYTIFADAETDLPVEARLEAKEVGKWRVREVMSFDYTSRETVFFSGSMAPRITEEEADARFVGAMTAKSLAEMPLRKGRLVIRSIDVAADGTVFVAYQSGKRSFNSWNGFALSLSDDLGTRYLRPQIFPWGRDGAKIPAEGVLEVEAFIPETPIAGGTSRTLTIGSRRFSNGKLARPIEAIMGGVKQWIDNGSGSDADARDVVLLTKKVGRSTCEAGPSYMSRIDASSFGDDVLVEMTKAGRRGKEAFEQRRWADAEKWLLEELRLNRKHERMGYGPWSQAAAKEMLAAIPRTP